VCLDILRLQPGARITPDPWAASGITFRLALLRLDFFTLFQPREPFK